MRRQTSQGASGHDLSEAGEKAATGQKKVAQLPCLGGFSPVLVVCSASFFSLSLSLSLSLISNSISLSLFLSLSLSVSLSLSAVASRGS